MTVLMIHKENAFDWVSLLKRNTFDRFPRRRSISLFSINFYCFLKRFK